VSDSRDLRKILSQNIKTIRGALRISQAKLAEHADISLSYLTDIERCRTWVSDKTLQSLAKTLNRKPWELLSPDAEKGGSAAGRDSLRAHRDEVQRMANLVASKREILCRAINQSMEDLVMEITKDD